MATRIVSLVLAAMFFISTVGFSVYVIIAANNEDEQREQTAAELTELQNQIDAANQQQTQDQGGDVLAGTQLQNFEPTETPVTELEIIDLVEGDGDVVEQGAQVTVHYTGATVRDGVIFESSLDSGSPITFGLEGLIVGWQEGIPGMKVGGTRRLVIPGEKAYGPYDANSSRPTGDLVFDIELIGITE